MTTTIGVAAAAALVFAACGSDDDPESVSEPTEEPAPATAEVVPATTQAPATSDTPEATTPAAPENASNASGMSLYDFRYCEILLTLPGDDGTEITEVWGTPGVDPCTDEAWYAIDPDAIQAENDASFVRMNGPRYFIVDGTADTGDGTGGTGVASGGESVIQQFGDVTMTLLATTEATGESMPYEPDLVVRTTTWTYEAGSEVYELTDPDGNVYTMQSYSLIEDRSLTAADLPTLGDRLDLPEGWSYSSRVLDEPLQVALSPDGAIVIQDELNNAYQRNG
ncbi:MAG: hypothetical protein AAFY28_21295 [Actinomycetota bacterium]